MNKFKFLFLSIFLIIGCSYEPILTSKEYKFKFSKISYDGDWTSFNYRKAMQDAGYKNGDSVDGKMFPTLFEKN